MQEIVGFSLILALIYEEYLLLLFALRRYHISLEEYLLITELSLDLCIVIILKLLYNESKRRVTAYL